MRTAFSSENLSSSLWNLFCTLSIIGIWPRFIEPSLILTTHLKFKIVGLPKALIGFKILQFSDLHFNAVISEHFLKKLSRKITELKPELILFTGEFLCYGKLEAPNRLLKFLNSLYAPYGCYAVLGNHDYAEAVSMNEAGDYDLIDSTQSSLKKAFLRLKKNPVITGKICIRAQTVPLNSTLLSLLHASSFKLLHNETAQIQVHSTKLNLSGLGEYMLGRCDPRQTFSNYDKSYPGIVMLHNPDGAQLLQKYPGNLILSGHTHGGQVNLPWIGKKFTLLENKMFKKGLQSSLDTKIYINRGVGSVLPFRWFSPPELLLLTLT